MQSPEVSRIRDIADQIDLLAYLVSAAADHTTGAEQRPRPLDLHLPAPGLNAMLRDWSDALLSALETAKDSQP